MNFPLLSNEQIKQVFDLRLLEMMRVIMYLIVLPILYLIIHEMKG